MEQFAATNKQVNRHVSEIDDLSQQVTEKLHLSHEVSKRTVARVRTGAGAGVALAWAKVILTMPSTVRAAIGKCWKNVCKRWPTVA